MNSSTCFQRKEETNIKRVDFAQQEQKGKSHNETEAKRHFKTGKKYRKDFFFFLFGKG